MTEKEKELKREMLKLVENIKEKTSDLAIDERIPDLELGFILSKIEKLHQSAVVLKYLHSHVDEIIEHSIDVFKEAEDVTSTFEAEVLEQPTVDAPQVITPEISVLHELESSEEASEISEEEIVEALETDQEFDIEKIQEDFAAMNPNAFGGETKNESFSADEGSLMERINRQPISNLKAAISLNDKFLFIQELFKGDNKLYEQTINELNFAADKSVANAVINRFSFDRNMVSAQDFLGLVERRFL